MHHFFAKQENIFDDHIIIDGADVNHIKNVLRLKVGDELLVSCDANVDYHCTVAMIDGDEVRLDIESADSEGRELPSRIYLFQGLPKKDKLELVIQKAVELGVYEVIPVAMKRSVVKIDEKKEKAKLERWNAIAESAAKQSNRSIIPQVRPCMDFKAAVDYAKGIDVRLLPYECAEGMQATRKLIAGIKPGQSIAVFIGPEGGFDGEELELAGQAGLEIITLGKRILRTETAGLMVLSVLMYHLEG